MSGALGVAAVAVLIVFGIYRRLRRTIGRQPIQPGRFLFRAGLFAVIGALILVPVAAKPLDLGGAAAGLAVGAALAFLGIRHTRFEKTAEGAYFVPNLYIGLLVFALFIGRLAYRLFGIYSHGGFSGSGAAASGMSFQNVHDPITLGLLLVFFSYYIFYYLGVVWLSKKDARAAS